MAARSALGLIILLFLLAQSQHSAYVALWRKLPPPGEAFGPANRGWWEGLDLPASEKAARMTGPEHPRQPRPVDQRDLSGVSPPEQPRAVGRAGCVPRAA